MTETELHELAGPYALNALDATELAEFEAHLATCATCQTDTAEFAETAAELSLLSLSTPPPALRDDILSAIRNTPQVPAEVAETVVPASVPTLTPRTPRASRPTVARRALPGTEIVDEPEPPQVDELALRRQRRRTRVLSGLVAAMLAVIVGLGGVVYLENQRQQTVVASQQTERELYQAPDAKTVVSNLKNGGHATFIVSKKLNRALFIGTDLPDPGSANRYQLWTGTGELTPTGIKSVSRDSQVTEPGAGAKVFFRGDVAKSDFLAVNVEPVGSTPAKPTTEVLGGGLI